jgi:hypothetical protein
MREERVTRSMDPSFEMIRGLLEAVQLVPTPYERFQPLVVDALLFFLRSLPAERMHRLTAKNISSRCCASAQRCISWHKL